MSRDIIDPIEVEIAEQSLIEVIGTTLRLEAKHSPNAATQEAAKNMLARLNLNQPLATAKPV